MKKFLSITLVLVMVLTLCACGKEELKDPNTVVIGDAQAVFTGCEIAKNSDGNDAIVLSFDYTNNSKDAQIFSFAMFYIIKQGDQELNYCTVYAEDGITELDSSLLHPVDPGQTQKVQMTYTLNDLATPVVIEFSDLFDKETASITVEIVK